MTKSFVIPWYEPWDKHGKYIHKEEEIFDGVIRCLHENMETIEEYKGSLYFINYCSDCGFFETVKKRG